MTTLRGIQGIYRGAAPHMVGDGFRVSNYFPSFSIPAERISPFILMDYNEPFAFPPSEHAKGVGAHPHKGFETVSIAYEGFVEHNDSFGNHGIIGPGDVQWMTAGSGLLHKEYHEREFSKRGGTFHFIQLWVNLPRAHKNHPPRYQALLKTDMGYVDLPDGAGQARVIAGEFHDVKGPAETFSPIHLFDISLKAIGNHVQFNLPASHNTAILVIKGSVTANGTTKANHGDLILYDHSEGDIRIEASEDDSMFIVLSGEPLHEPVVQHGPFVMNTKEEIAEAFRDFQAGKMGNLNF